MKLKRFVVLMVTLLIGICLVSCDQGGSGDGGDETKTYKITYVLNGGTLEANAPSSYDDAKGVTLPSPEKVGAQFAGWYFEADFSGTLISKINKNTGKDVTVYAKWNVSAEGDVYPIYFHWNDGVAPANVPSSYDSAAGLPDLPQPTKEKHQFGGWYNNSACTGDAVTAIAPGTEGEVNLYAKWIAQGEIIFYTITYICEGGTLPADAPTQYQGGVGCILPEPTPNKEGEDFLGWYDKQSGAQIDRITDNVYRHITLEAKFGVKQAYVPKWDLNAIGFDGQGMTYEIKVLPVTEYDPFNPDYSGSGKSVKQAHQTEVEDAYNIIIKYSNWEDAAPWGPERVKFINKQYLNDEFGDVYVVNIASQWIPTLVKGGSIAELYNLQNESGIFGGLSNEEGDDYGYEQDETINAATSVKQRVYGYALGAARPDYFMYYNADKVKALNLEDPAELWMKGEWTTTKFDAWVRTAQNALTSEGGYVLDMGFAESIIGMTAAVGNSMTKVNPPLLYLTNTKVTSTIERLQEYYQGGFYSSRSVQDVAPGFQAGTTLLHHGDLWFMKESTRFNPTIMTFTIGVVPYPAEDGEGGIPVTTKDQSEAILIGNDEYLKDSSGNFIKTVDMDASSFQVPYTGTSCYSILNIENGKNGMNAEFAMHILHDLLGGLGDDPNAAATLSDDEAYRNYLETRFDREIDVEVIMSCQGKTYFELMELLSMTVGGGSHFGDGAWWPLAANIVKSEDSPATKLNEVLNKYKQAMIDLGYNIQ